MIKRILREFRESLIRLSQGYIGCALTNYGEIFARNVLRKFYANAITPVIANTDYEGQIKGFGDRVNIMMFLEDIPIGTYAVGTNMTVTNPVDTEVSLHINEQKYYCFDIDTVDNKLSYVEDQGSVLIENAAKTLERTVDQKLLRYYMEECGAGNRVPKYERSGCWTYVVGDAGTYVIITTTAATGVATFVGMRGPSAPDTTLEDGWLPGDIIGRGFRVCSDLANSQWYRITGRTSSQVLLFNNWDGSLSGAQVIARLFEPEGYPGVYTAIGYGAQIEGMKATQVTAANVYELCTELAEALDTYDVPQENRHLTVPPWFKSIMVRATEVQVDIAIYHEEVIRNGRIGRIAGFEVHMASDDRFSITVQPIANPSAVAGVGGLGDGWVAIYGASGYKILANHIGFITFAHKWSESRVVDAENQFAKLYQGLNLYGFKVTNQRRKCGAYIFGYK